MKVLGSEQTALSPLLTLISQLWGLFADDRKGGEVGPPERGSLLSDDSNQEVSD